jgi:hypothetical protein
MLREYTSIPQKRLACQIEETGKIEKVKEGVAKYTNKVGAIQELMEFKYSEGQKPEPGDYIVKESKTNVYLVKKDLFERTYRSTGFKLS